MDLEFFHRVLNVDSTSGKEARLADMLAAELSAPGRKVEVFEVGDGTRNVLVSWGRPKVVFCTHLDTVPPYIPPVIMEPLHRNDSMVSEGEKNSESVKGCIRGRGTCDAKGQLLAMYEACKTLEAKGYDGFGLLLLAGEETGSFGAKAFNAMMEGGDRAGIDENAWIVVGEPTDNLMASAAKGTKSFEVTFTGVACHSGYPQNGQSAVMYFNDFVNAIRSIAFPVDPMLGETTWNIGKLNSDNPQNILSDRLTCRVYFRTTFESDQMVCNIMKNMAGEDAKLRFGRPKAQDGSDIVGKDVAPWQKAMSVVAYGGDSPSCFDVLPGFDSAPVAFGSDAPQLKCFSHKILCGPGSILVAHRDEEHILLSDIEKAVGNYVRIFEIIEKR
jgi:acetylornithine deacetylase